MRLLLADERTEGACNRAHYAMFDAAHGARRAAGVEQSDHIIKTHNGLIAVFGRELVRTGRMAASFGRSLNTVQNFRLIADYEGDSPILDDTTEAVRLAEAFVAEIRAVFFAG